ncbi:MAG: response regulator, partial [Azonexus sp.]
MPEATLIIDDDATFNAVLVRTLERRGHPARGVADPVAALAVAAELVPARVVLDLNLNGSSGLALIPRLLAINPDCRVVVLTGYASITTAVDAIKLGAVQYLAKPVEIEAI